MDGAAQIEPPPSGAINATTSNSPDIGHAFPNAPITQYLGTNVANVQKLPSYLALGPSRGGIPPECKPIPLSAEVEAKLLARAQADLSGWLDALKNHHAELRNALLSAFPVDKCWQ